MSNYTNHNLTQSDYKQCKYCTKYFIGSSSNRIYCSQSCQRERRKEYQRQISKQRYKQRRTCRHCGKISAVKNLYKSQCCFDKKCIELENDRKPQSGPIQKIKYKEKNTQSRSYKKNYRKRTRRLWLENYKKNRKCEKCEEDRWFCLEFHHVDRENKSFGIAQGIAKDYSLNAIKEEINKCVILCSNCHKHFHFLEQDHNFDVRKWLKYSLEESQK